MRIIPTNKRKAISPVLATVILIAITLIAAIAIAGFVFGLFGTFTSTARVQASVTSCVLNGAAPNHEYCNLILTNSGNANTNAVGACSLTFGGASYGGYSAATLAAAVSPGAAVTITAGSSATLICQAGSGGGAGAGSQVTGSVILANGGNALFSATATS